MTRTGWTVGSTTWAKTRKLAVLLTLVVLLSLPGTFPTKPCIRKTPVMPFRLGTT